MDQIYANHPLPILESRLDWLSATVKPGERQTILKGRVAAWIDRRVEQGYDRRGFQTPLYKGERTDGIAFGERTDDALVTLSGAMAQLHGPTLITWADTISRVDVQVTLREPNLRTNWAAYVDTLASLDERVKSGQLSTRLITSRPRGITAYIGHGASDRMLRCYDKTAESEDRYPPGCWRWEVQYRHKRAEVVAHKLLDGSVLAAECLGVVCSAYRYHNIVVPTLCLSNDWKDAGITLATDDERRLEWLKRCVAPAVERLSDHFGIETVLDALGMNGVIDTLESQAEAIKSLIDTNETLRGTNYGLMKNQMETLH
jgi:hypothetical protein